jgi:hypothetical protein
LSHIPWAPCLLGKGSSPGLHNRTLTSFSPPPSHWIKFVPHF